MLLTRVERKRMFKRRKRRFKLFISTIIILVLVSIIHINNTYNELLDSSEVNQIFSIKKDEDVMGITLFGEQIEISKDYIEEGKGVLQYTQKKILYWINNIIKIVND